LWERRLGTALATQAITARAADLLAVPLPVDDEAWQAGADAVAHGDPAVVAAHMVRAYRSSPAITEWWSARLGV